MTWRIKTMTMFMGLAAWIWTASTVPAFDYTLQELEQKIDESPRVKLLLAKLEEKTQEDSVWNHVHLSVGLNPVRTARKFTDTVRAGFAVSIPFEVFKKKDYRAEMLELKIIRQDLKREVRKTWFDRQRRTLEIRQLELELAGARLVEEKVRVKLTMRDASLDDLKAAELVGARIETQILEKQMDIRDLEDQLLALVGEL